jgi:hypothetical protein
MEHDREHDGGAPHPDPDPQPQGDPRREPENSTVDEWFGQSVERDAALADELVEQEHGDQRAAERRFDDLASGEDEQAERHGRGPGR